MHCISGRHIFTTWALDKGLALAVRLENKIITGNLNAAGILNSDSGSNVTIQEVFVPPRILKQQVQESNQSQPAHTWTHTDKQVD